MSKKLFIEKYKISIEYILLILSILLIISIITVGFLYSKNNSLENRINTLSKQIEETSVCDEGTMQELAKRQFKEDYYIQQQNKDTSLILFIFGLVVTSFGLVSFSIFNTRIKQVVKENEDKHEEHLTNYKDFEHKLSDFKYDFYMLQASVNMEKAIEFNTNPHWHIYYTLLGVSYYSEAFEWNRKLKRQSLMDSSINHQKSVLTDLVEFINNNTKQTLPKTTFLYCLNNIRRFNNEEINILVSKIHTSVDTKEN